MDRDVGGGDFNAHNTLWGGKLITSNVKSDLNERPGLM
jgi:hypothetical protein